MPKKSPLRVVPESTRTGMASRVAFQLDRIRAKPVGIHQTLSTLLRASLFIPHHSCVVQMINPNRTERTGQGTRRKIPPLGIFFSFPPPAATAQPFVGGQSLLLLSSTSSRVCASNCVLGHCRSSGTTTDEYIFESAYMEWEKSLLLEFHSPSRFVHTLYSLNTHTQYL